MGAQAQIADLFTAAFKDPIPATKMIGFRFTVGGGKKVRQKYGDDMPKYCRCGTTMAEAGPRELMRREQRQRARRAVVACVDAPRVTVTRLARPH